MDTDGNDNTPEWGYCTHPGCRNTALPIWLSGDYPDDPDLLLCPKHVGARIAALQRALREILVPPRWLSIGTLNNVAEFRVSRGTYERAVTVAYEEFL